MKNLLHHLTETNIRHELRGFPERTVQTVVSLKHAPSTDLLRRAVVEILTFYLPSGGRTDLSDQAPTARLREDLGVDSLTFAEAAFKMEELFAVRIENADLAKIKTLGDLQAFATEKLLDKPCVASS